MSLRLEMLQVARLAPRLLGDSTDLVKGFLLRQRNDDGGFRGRDGASDLYYTAFGLEGLLALQVAAPAGHTATYLDSFSDLRRLDFVHLCCLARCRANLAQAAPQFPFPASLREAVSTRIAEYRSADGGFHATPNAPRGSAYAAFLALGALQDCQAPLSEPEKLAQSLQTLKTPDGAYTNDSCIRVGSTNATAAAVAVLRNLGVAPDPAVGDWLLARCQPGGGFLAVPNAPIPDLLSTATALHALAGLQCDFAHLKEPCLDFLDTLWVNDGGFHGHWGDHHLDVEYTYYALLALGHLSLQ